MVFNVLTGRELTSERAIQHGLAIAGWIKQQGDLQYAAEYLNAAYLASRARQLADSYKALSPALSANSR